MCLSQLSLSEVQGSEKNLIGQLVSQLSLRENVVQEEPWGLLSVFLYVSISIML